MEIQVVYGGSSHWHGLRSNGSNIQNAEADRKQINSDLGFCPADSTANEDLSSFDFVVSRFRASQRIRRKHYLLCFFVKWWRERERTFKSNFFLSASSSPYLILYENYLILIFSDIPQICNKGFRI